jgi:hydroxyacylglutathione hydrolase
MQLEIRQIDIPNPFFEGRNRAYVIVTDPITLIDTGVATSRAFEALQAGLKEHGLQVRDVRRIVLTHKHIDHVGNAWRIQQTSGAEVWIHRSECEAVTHPDPEGREFVELVAGRLRQWHAPLKNHSESFESVMPRWEIEPVEVHDLVDGQQLDSDHGPLDVIHTPGHTAGSICLRFGHRLFTGDHLLPDISPNVGGGDLRHRGLLQQFLDSLNRIQQLEAIDLALPGHGQPFTAWIDRCQELYRHHMERLREIEGILAKHGPLTVFQIAAHLFGELADFHVVLGCAEAHAHLEWLIDRGRVQTLPDGQRFDVASGT